MRMVNWLQGLRRRLLQSRPRSRRRTHWADPIHRVACVAVVEQLENRTLLSAVTWTGGGDGQNWGDAANWSTGQLPGTADDVTINAPGNPTIVHSAGATSIHSLVSYDPINLSGGSLTLYDSSAVYGQFNNSATVEILAGALQLVDLASAAGVITTGNFYGAAGTSLSLGQGNLSAVSSVQADQVRLQSITLNGAYSALSTYTFGGVLFTGVAPSIGALTDDGGVDISPADTVTPVTLTSLDLHGALLGTANVVVSGQFNWNGELDGSGSLTALGGMQISNPYSVVMNGRTLNNAGTALWQEGRIRTFNGAVINNLAGATFDAESGVPLTWEAGAAPTFHNAGTFRKTGTADGGQYDVGATLIDGTFVNTGTVEAQVGMLYFADGYTQTAGSTTLDGGSIASSSPLDIERGSLAGNGTIFGSVTSAGTTSPGFSPGLITISGNDTQQSSGQLSVELGGATPGTQYDQVAVSGNVTLAGTLNLALINGFQPALNQKFVIVKKDGSGAVSGAFTGLAEGATISAGGWLFQISYKGCDGNDVTLTAVTQSTTTKLTSSTSTSTYGDQVSFAATVIPQSSGVPVGTATFYEVTSTGGIISQLGTGTLNGSGVATFAYDGFSAGTHYVVAKFTSNDAAFLNSPLSNSVQLTVGQKTITGVIAACNKIYDGTTSATIYSQTLVGVLDADLGNVLLTIGSASFSDANAGANKLVTATGLTLGGSAAGNYVLSSTTATTTANITAKVLTATGSTQNTINISKSGTITFAIANVSGKVDGDTRTTYQLFNGSKFTLQIGSHVYSVVSTASVDQKSGTIYVSWNMSAELYNDLVAVLGTDTSPSTKKLTDLIVSGYSSDGNYEITADCMTNIFSSGKVVWS